MPPTGRRPPPQPWSNATIDLNGLNYVDAQARISAAALNVGDARFAPAAIDVTLNSGVLKTQISNLGAYDGNANGDLTIDASTANPSFALRADLTGVRALPLLKSVADFDKLDGKMQTKISVRSTGTSQRAIMAGLQGTTFVVFQDGAIRGLNVAQMIRSLTSGTLSGWQEGNELKTDLSQLSASFKIDKGQAVTTDLNLVGPLVRMTGVGTIALDTKQIGFRVEPKLVMTTEGQGRANDPVGFGIPVMIEGPWGAPKIYPDMQGILDNPDAAYAKLKEMGKGLFGPNSGGLGAVLGPNSGGLGAALGGLLGGGQQGARVDNPARAAGKAPAADKAADKAPASRAICSVARSARPSAICCSRPDWAKAAKVARRRVVPARPHRGRTASAAFRCRASRPKPSPQRRPPRRRRMMALRSRTARR